MNKRSIKALKKALREYELKGWTQCARALGITIRKLELGV